MMNVPNSSQHQLGTMQLPLGFTYQVRDPSHSVTGLLWQLPFELPAYSFVVVLASLALKIGPAPNK